MEAYNYTVTYQVRDTTCSDIIRTSVMMVTTCEGATPAALPVPGLTRAEAEARCRNERLSHFMEDT